LRLVLAARSQDERTEFGDGVFELAAGVALVADNRFAACERARLQGQSDLPLGAVGGNERGCPRRAVGGASEVQPHPPNQREWLLE
jgi:hypothetical protein